VPSPEEFALPELLGQLREEYVQECAALDSLPIVNDLTLEEQTLKTGLFAKTDSQSQRVVTTVKNTLPEAAEPGFASRTALRESLQAPFSCNLSSALQIPSLLLWCPLPAVQSQPVYKRLPVPHASLAPVAVRSSKSVGLPLLLNVPSSKHFHVKWSFA